ncbi:MAG: hypothetical protein KDK36_17390, partial [Leptospiraceae bacterium]|nr:hypothetical protein [Leptospiraceae bacterium]
MSKPPRIFDSEIIVNENNRWFFRGNEIIQENVLEFFKKSLFEDDKGIYIHNTHGELSEQGYITSFGFPLKIINWIQNEDGKMYFVLDSGETIEPIEINFYYDSSEKLFCMRKKDKYIKINFNRKT